MENVKATLTVLCKGLKITGMVRLRFEFQFNKTNRLYECFLGRIADRKMYSIIYKPEQISLPVK